MGLRSAHLSSMLKLLHLMSSFGGDGKLFKREEKERGGGEAGEEKLTNCDMAQLVHRSPCNTSQTI